MSRRPNSSLADSPVVAVRTSKSFSRRSVSTLRTCGSSSTIRSEHLIGPTGWFSYGAGHTGLRHCRSRFRGSALPSLIAHPRGVSKRLGELDSPLRILAYDDYLAPLYGDFYQSSPRAIIFDNK